MSSNILSERVLGFIQSKGYKPQTANQLAKTLSIAEKNQEDFHHACKALMKTGQVVRGQGNVLMLPPPPGKIIGVFRGNLRGFGFVIPDVPNAQGDLYIPSGATKGAMTGDEVSAKVMKRGKRGGKMLFEGRIITILKHGQTQAVGQLRRKNGQWLVVPDGNRIHLPIQVGDAKAKGAREGDQVVVEIIRYPTERTGARGAIVKVLGRHGRPGVDTLSIIEQYKLPGAFDEAVLQDARDAAAGFNPGEEAQSREVLNHLTIITIDPNDAGDFDDAVSLVPNAEGGVELGVHIADVAHFVRENSPLDREARERSNSVYLPGTVLPMLPEILSNEVCSLQERQPRLTKSVFIRYDRRGRVKRVRLANTMIRSTKRLTYEQATRILDGKPGRTSAKVVALLKEMEKLALLILARRRREGMLELELPQIDPVHDEDGAVIGVQPADTGFSHKIIEMFMLEANEAVAGVLQARGVPFLRRIHDEPREPSGNTLLQFLRAMGHALPASPDRFALQKLLEKVRGTPDGFSVHLAVLRSMQQAQYSPLQLGHYALASRHYCHFTSPIRRYPDLTIHRLVDWHLNGRIDAESKDHHRSTRDGAGNPPSQDELFALGAQCSANERRAEEAERELKLVLMLRWLAQHTGKEFDGIVTGVASFGVFVQLKEVLIDGLLRLDQLSGSRWKMDEARSAVVGERGGPRIKVGDRLRVVIIRIDLPTRKLELALARPQIDRRERKHPSHSRPRGAGKARSKKIHRKGKKRRRNH
ncbi:MAG: ribonuclease R [Planctomycetes bacterium]|nr:ribonuclease R [Planctomycetota bacterium]